jgi:hypothetical protein
MDVSGRSERNDCASVNRAAKKEEETARIMISSRTHKDFAAARIALRQDCLAGLRIIILEF